MESAEDRFQNGWGSSFPNDDSFRYCLRAAHCLEGPPVGRLAALFRYMSASALVRRDFNESPAAHSAKPIEASMRSLLGPERPCTV